MEVTTQVGYFRKETVVFIKTLMPGGTSLDLPNKHCREMFSSVLCVAEQSGLTQGGRMRMGVTPPPPFENTQSLEPGYGTPRTGLLFVQAETGFVNWADYSFGLDHLLQAHPHTVGMKKCMNGVGRPPDLKHAGRV
jgi:hypothetical protein